MRSQLVPLLLILALACALHPAHAARRMSSVKKECHRPQRSFDTNYRFASDKDARNAGFRDASAAWGRVRFQSHGNLSVVHLDSLPGVANITSAGADLRITLANLSVVTWPAGQFYAAALNSNWTGLRNSSTAGQLIWLVTHVGKISTGYVLRTAPMKQSPGTIQAQVTFEVANTSTTLTKRGTTTRPISATLWSSGTNATIVKDTASSIGLYCENCGVYFSTVLVANITLDITKLGKANSGNQFCFAATKGNVNGTFDFLLDLSAHSGQYSTRLRVAEFDISPLQLGTFLTAGPSIYLDVGLAWGYTAGGTVKTGFVSALDFNVAAGVCPYVNSSVGYHSSITTPQIRTTGAIGGSVDIIPGFGLGVKVLGMNVESANVELDFKLGATVNTTEAYSNNGSITLVNATLGSNGVDAKSALAQSNTSTVSIGNTSTSTTAGTSDAVTTTSSPSTSNSSTTESSFATTTSDAALVSNEATNTAPSVKTFTSTTSDNLASSTLVSSSATTTQSDEGTQPGATTTAESVTAAQSATTETSTTSSSATTSTTTTTGPTLYSAHSAKSAALRRRGPGTVSSMDGLPTTIATSLPTSPTHSNSSAPQSPNHPAPSLQSVSTTSKCGTALAAEVNIYESLSWRWSLTGIINTQITFPLQSATLYDCCIGLSDTGAFNFSSGCVKPPLTA
ncbi:hypothetical protein M427DRAFT_29329 [Gonapodya prolifera JEL478]|uniref:Uncharacterized protein n=1 Tax=Gonapodya prolifera (strain JEL478) TaxID=1344416 RepID=A0A139AQ58_GONPJ|nr:hypothetical protein M427DRAFT_29329 [Gonapodya prolifera JEL478]|eukprot:KXS18862.1 hypothetical protein M427DRAFT_29329 [Gonapodya prolifera JEL478]